MGVNTSLQGILRHSLYSANSSSDWCLILPPVSEQWDYPSSLCSGVDVLLPQTGLTSHKRRDGPSSNTDHSFPPCPLRMACGRVTSASVGRDHILGKSLSRWKKKQLNKITLFCMIPNVRWWPGNNFPHHLWLALLVFITEHRSSLQRVIGSLSHRTGVESVVRWVRMEPRASGSCRGKLISSFNVNRSQRSRVLWAISVLAFSPGDGK